MKSIQKPELLAPAGGWDQLRCAILYGADAVYLSCKNFGMRARATNFDINNIKEAVNFAHNHKTKVYVTCNILMHENDIAKLPDYFKKLKEANVDAFIISDMGAAKIAREIAPNIALHVSTQASVANSSAAITWAKLGAKRIVLAREMSISQIEQMRDNLVKAGYDSKTIQLEAFVHGAMCMSISGRCLISTYLTDRSANKGLCTQPCRWGYNVDFYEEKRKEQKFNAKEDDYGTYIFNSKDMCMIDHLDDLVSAGISSFKIEGRNKKAMYVATCVNAYRHAIDALYSTNYKKKSIEWKNELNNISHRPYSTGFYYGSAQQSIDYDGYEQDTIHVADVIKCSEQQNMCAVANKVNNSDQSQYIIDVLCRNHFENNSKLEAIIPYSNIKTITIENLSYKNKRIDIANRAKEIYSFTCPYKLQEGVILRNREKLRTCRK